MINTDARRARTERGFSLSVLVTLSMVMVTLVLGLVVDGGRQLAAQQRAEAVAHQAARAGSDAAAPAALTGHTDPIAARRAAEASLSDAGVRGHVVVHGNRVRVTTAVEQPTLFLSMIGISAVRGTGAADSALFPNPA